MERHFGARCRRNLRLATVRSNVAHDRLELGKNFRLPEREFRILLSVIERNNHIFNLWNGQPRRFGQRNHIRYQIKLYLVSP